MSGMTRALYVRLLCTIHPITYAMVLAAAPWSLAAAPTSLPSPLLSQLEGLHCADDEANARHWLKILCQSPSHVSPPPWDRLDSDGATLHIASFDAMLRVLDETAARFPRLTTEVERCVLQWDYCSLRQNRAFVDIELRQGEIVRCPPSMPWPGGGEGLKRWGFLPADPVDRRVPGLLLNSGMGHAEHTMFIHRVYRKQCFPHPQTGALPDEETRPTPYGPLAQFHVHDASSNCASSYPFAWSPRCEREAGRSEGYSAGYRNGYLQGYARGTARALSQLREEYERQFQLGERLGREKGAEDGRLGVTRELSSCDLPWHVFSATGAPGFPEDKKGGAAAAQSLLQRTWDRASFETSFNEGHRQGEYEGGLKGFDDALEAKLDKALELVRQCGLNDGQSRTYPKAWAQTRQEALLVSKNMESELTAPQQIPQATKPRRLPLEPTTPSEDMPEAQPELTPPPPSNSTPPAPTSEQASAGPLPPPPGPHGLSGSIFHAWRMTDGAPEVGASFSWAPAQNWFMRAGVRLDYRSHEAPLTYNWGMGYDDHHAGTWSLQINNWGPILPGEGLKLDSAVFNIGYKLKHDWLEENRLAANIGLDVPMEGAKALSTTWQWSPIDRWFVRVAVAIQEDDPSHPKWSYGFGRLDWRAYTWTLQYNNWGPNEAFSPNFKQNGTVMLGWSWSY